MQEMTEIIPGLQGNIAANSRKGFPYVGDKYGIIDSNTFLRSVSLKKKFRCFTYTFYE